VNANDIALAVRRYHEAWAELDEASRLAALEAFWAEDGVYIDPEVPEGVIGRRALSDQITASHEEMPGLTITASSELAVLSSRAWYRWTAKTGDGEEFSGTDFIELAQDGRIQRVTNFFDEDPATEE
jgi:ketosteroid isomerase-like protein